MLTSIRIQNFRSIRDAQVKLGQVNLFIGPNNSGKSNFLNGIEFLTDITSSHSQTFKPKKYNFESILSRNAVFTPPEIKSINFKVAFSRDDIDAAIFAIGRTGIIGQLNSDLSELVSLVLPKGNHVGFFPNENRSLLLLHQYLKDTYIFKPDPSKFQVASNIIYEYIVKADASNLVSIIFDLSQNHKARFKALEADLARCVGDLVSISTPADPDETGKFKLKFFDQNDIGYWAEEVSEGVLYFLALLCIIHQQEQPKVLLIEEPEKGIHPRRIKEVMDFIFELARMRDIQIIITSHSPYVVDHFADIPECISVFDRVDGETVINNAADIIRKTNEEYAAQGLPPTKYTDSLGEYWVSGFLGGVPL